ncbi:MAG: GreA/GreB family elongation factor [Mariprofundaceae bacterium]|nr:GreA/GreB family elongation factor [Mariprofundaceae bacterium]
MQKIIHPMPDKRKIIAAIIHQLETDISIAEQAVKTAHDTATHKDCLGSSKYETMGTEASYLAQGQGLRLLEIKRALAYFKQLTLPQPATRIALCSLVTLHDKLGQQQNLWLAADAGGLKIQLEKTSVTVITAKSPLGCALLGKEAGDDVEIRIAAKQHCYEITDVC